MAQNLHLLRSALERPDAHPTWSDTAGRLESGKTQAVFTVLSGPGLRGFEFTEYKPSDIAAIFAHAARKTHYCGLLGNRAASGGV